MWPQHVKERIKATYLYFGSSIAVTAVSAAAAFRSPVIMNLVTRNGFMVSVLLCTCNRLLNFLPILQGIAASLVAIIGTGMLAQGIEYKPGKICWYFFI